MEWNDPECFRQFVYQPSVSRSHSLSLSFSLSPCLVFYARPASILFRGGLFKHRALFRSIDRSRNIPTSCQGFVSSSFASDDEISYDGWYLAIKCCLCYLARKILLQISEHAIRTIFTREDEQDTLIHLPTPVCVIFRERNTRVVRNHNVRKALGTWQSVLNKFFGYPWPFCISRIRIDPPWRNNRGIVDGLKHHTLQSLKRMQIVRSPRVRLLTRTRPPARRLEYLCIQIPALIEWGVCWLF